jgi:hypothetical protein
LLTKGVGEATSNGRWQAEADELLQDELDTSPKSPDGSLTTLQIASAALGEKRKVLLIDADERIRCLSQLCGVSDKAPGERNRHEPLAVKADEAVVAKDYVRRLVLTRSGMVLPARPKGSGSGHRSTPLRAALAFATCWGVPGGAGATEACERSSPVRTR